MSQAKLDEISVLCAKAEVTPGTAISLTGSDGGFIVFNASLEPTVDFNQREGNGGMSQFQGVSGSQMGKLTFEVELVGSGSSSDPAWATVFLPACGFVGASGVYAPLSGSAACITAALFENGLRRQIAGAQGTFTITYNKGKPARVKFEFTGKYSAEADATIPTPTWSTVVPPACEGMTVTAGGYAPIISEIVVAANNTVKLRESLSDATGYFACAITKRRCTVSMDPESSSVATRGWYAALLANTQEAISIALGSVLHNTITVAAPAAQLTKKGRKSRDGLICEDVEWQCNRSASAGDDELTITFA